MMSVTQLIVAPAFLLTCLCYGVGAAMLPAVMVTVLIEHYQPRRRWRVLGWGVVGAAFLTPSAVAVAAVLLH